MALRFNTIKKNDLADFFQKMSMLLDAGYDACSAVTLLAAMPPEGKNMTGLQTASEA